MNKEIKEELTLALNNIESVRSKIKQQLYEIQKEDTSDSNQVHLLISSKLELLDLKHKLNGVIECVDLIKFN